VIPGPVLQEQPDDHTAADASGGEASPGTGMPSTSARARLFESAAHVGTLLLSAALVGWLDRGLWFFKDEFEFFARRVGAHGRTSILEPHNEHWSTLPILVYRALYSQFGLHTYLPYLAVLVAVHVMIVHLLWLACRRVGAGPVATTVTCLTLGLLGGGWEDLTWAFQIGFLSSVLAAWGQTLLVDHGGRWGRRDLLGWVVGVAGMTCSGMSVPLLALPVLTALLRRGLRAAVLTAVAPAAAFVLWYATSGRPAAGTPSPGPQLPRPVMLARYLWTGVRSAAAQTMILEHAGVLLVALLLAGVATRLLPLTGRAALSTAGLLTVPMTYGFIALGRATLHGVEQAATSRYVYPAVTLALPATALLASRASARLRPPRRRDCPTTATHRVTRLPVVGAVLVLLGVVVVIHNGLLLRQKAHIVHARDQQTRAAVLAGLALVRSGEPTLDNVSADPQSGFSSFPVLSWLDQEGAFPREIRVTQRRLANARLRGQISLAATELPERTAPLRIVAGPGTRLTVGTTPDCLAARPTRRGGVSLVLATTGAPGWLVLRPDRSTRVRAYWEDPGRGLRSDPGPPVYAEAGPGTRVLVLAPTGQAVVQVAGTSAEACGVTVNGPEPVG
jgi:hypothetical protein